MGLVLIVLLVAILVATVTYRATDVVVGAIPTPDAFSEAVPDLGEATTRSISQPSVILAADGSVIGRFKPEELYVPLDAEDLPPNVVTAAVAAEDASFWEHRGVDFQGIVRAFVKNIREGEIKEGGSTITQQLVKNLFTSGDKTLDRKTKEIALAIQLEREYEKEEILAAYLNTAFFGEGAIGAAAASRTYFRKPVHDLSLSEAAMLVSVIPAPSAYNPRANPEVAEARRQLVLDRVEDAGLAPPEAIEVAREQVPVVHPRRAIIEDHPYFIDYVRRWLLDVKKVHPDDLYTRGWTIETTLEPGIQAVSRASMNQHLPHGSNPWAASATVDRITGEVRALVGGRNWEHVQVNLALGRLGGGTGRQPGSSFKPFVLAQAYEAGASPHDIVDAPEVLPIAKGHEIHNYTQRGYDPMTLARATERSINTSFVGVAQFIGLENVVELAHRLGIRNIPKRGVSPTVAIGTYEVSPLRMASAYAAFGNDGIYVEPRPVRRILDRDGAIVADFSHPDSWRALQAENARLVTQTLRGVIQNGTGRAADIGRPTAGKTGTSDDYSNAWFVGYTPQLSTAVWVGYPQGNIPMRNINGVRAVSGGTFPARIWADIMAIAHQDRPVLDFPPAPFRPPAQPPPPQPPPPGLQPPAATVSR
jgi:penicillin-binding protein 1A